MLKYTLNVHQHKFSQYHKGVSHTSNIYLCTLIFSNKYHTLFTYSYEGPLVIIRHLRRVGIEINELKEYYAREVFSKNEDNLIKVFVT